jgi:8-oxo-dGTP diphosphatase
MSSAREYLARPLLGTGVVVLDGDGERVLLIRRARAPRLGQWSLPGGLVEIGETLEAAARREVLEETGLELGPLRLLDAVDLIERDAGGRVRTHYVLVDFTARAVVGTRGLALVLAADEVGEAGWFAPTALDALGLWCETIRIIRLAFERP